MKVIVGLGNPGEKYVKTRHNVGFSVLDELLKQSQKSKVKSQNHNLKFKSAARFKAEIARVGDVLLVKPQTFMNKSGEAVSEIVRFYKVEMDDLWVVHDDLDIRLGEYKIQKGVGPKVHNGISDVEKKLGGDGFWRVRVGVDNRAQSSEFRIQGEDYVLGRFSGEEREMLEGVVEKIAGEIVDQLDGGVV